jgi:hypothetical protein
VVQVREKKTRFRDVVHEDRKGIAKREAKGRDSGVRRLLRDILALRDGYDIWEVCSWVYGPRNDKDTIFGVEV